MQHEIIALPQKFETSTANSWGDEGALALSDALKVNTTLTALLINDLPVDNYCAATPRIMLF